MARERRHPDVSKTVIINAAIAVLSTKGARGFTIDAVAKRAACAKGLVHYHFKTKGGLSAAVAQSVLDSRVDQWRKVLTTGHPSEAIGKTWNMLVNESTMGSLRTWDVMFGEASLVPDQLVSESLQAFAAAMGEAVSALLVRLGMRPRIPPSEIGWLCSAVVFGMGDLLERGVPPTSLEGSYSAAWLGILSLAEARSG